MNILELLDSKEIDYEQKSDQEFVITCVTQHLHAGGKDSHKSLSINIVKEVAFCPACGFALSQAGLHRWLMGEDLDDLQLRGLEVKGIFDRLEEPKPLYIENKEVFFPSGEPWVDEYRGISPETYAKLGAVKVTRGRYQNRIAFPIYVNGVLVGVDARALGDEQPKYLRNAGAIVKSTWLYPLDIVKAMKPKMVLLGEGIFHAVNGIDKLIPTLAFFGANNWSQDKVMLLLTTGAEEICYVPDADIPGFQAGERVCAALVPWFKVSVADMGQYYGTKKDLGDLTKEEIETALANRGKPILPLCLLENWEYKIKWQAECKKWKCPHIHRKDGICQHRLYEKQEVK